MKSTYFLALSALCADATIAQEIPLGGISPELSSIDEITVHSPTLGTFEKLLGDSEADWLLYATASKETCPRCPVYDKIFNETVVALQHEPNLSFARMNCDNHTVLCNTFFAYGAGHLYHLTHSRSPSHSVTAVGMPLVLHTHIRSIPFHPKIAAAPAAEKKDAEEGKPADEGTSHKEQILESKSSAKPSSEWIVKVVQERLWKDIDEWKGWTHPFDGSGRHAVRAAWWITYQVSSMPPFVTLLAITLGGRMIVGRIFSPAPRPQQRSQRAAAAPASS